MTLQKLLLKLSLNKAKAVTCHLEDNILSLKIQESYTYKDVLKVDIDLRNKLSDDVIQQLKPYCL